MSVIPKLARRSLRARIGRGIAIGLAILASVSFVSGSFILADSLKATFDNLFTELTADVDLEVRSVLTVDDISTPSAIPSRHRSNRPSATCQASPWPKADCSARRPC